MKRTSLTLLLAVALAAPLCCGCKKIKGYISGEAESVTDSDSAAETPTDSKTAQPAEPAAPETPEPEAKTVETPPPAVTTVLPALTGPEKPVEPEPPKIENVPVYFDPKNTKRMAQPGLLREIEFFWALGEGEIDPQKAMLVDPDGYREYTAKPDDFSKHEYLGKWRERLLEIKKEKLSDVYWASCPGKYLEYDFDNQVIRLEVRDLKYLSENVCACRVGTGGLVLRADGVPAKAEEVGAATQPEVVGKTPAAGDRPEKTEPAEPKTAVVMVRAKTNLGVEVPTEEAKKIIQGYGIVKYSMLTVWPLVVFSEQQPAEGEPFGDIVGLVITKYDSETKADQVIWAKPNPNFPQYNLKVKN